MKAETTRTVAPRAIMPLFFVHSTLRNFILCFHLPPVCFQSSLSILLLVRVTLWKLAWYYHNRRPAARSCTALPRLLRTLIHAHSFTLHFSHFTSHTSLPTTHHVLSSEILPTRPPREPWAPGLSAMILVHQ